MNWWNKRRAVPKHGGFIRVEEKPSFFDSVAISGGREQAVLTASEAIALFEQSIDAQEKSKLELFDIRVCSDTNLLNAIPLCPTPGTESVSECRSLAVKVDKDFFREYWFLVQVAITGTGFSWRIDACLRRKVSGMVFCIALASVLVLLMCRVVGIEPGAAGLPVLPTYAVMVALACGLGISHINSFENNAGQSEYALQVNKMWLEALHEVSRPSQQTIIRGQGEGSHSSGRSVLLTRPPNPVDFLDAPSKPGDEGQLPSIFDE